MSDLIFVSRHVRARVCAALRRSAICLNPSWAWALPFCLASTSSTRFSKSWFNYTIAMLTFSLAGFLSLYALQRLQNLLPLNLQGSTGE